MKAKRWKAGVSGILERAVAADPIGSDETNASSGVPAPDQSGLAGNGRAMRHPARGRREWKIETGSIGISRDPLILKRSSLPPFKWTSYRKSAPSPKLFNRLSRDIQLIRFSGWRECFSSARSAIV